MKVYSQKILFAKCAYCSIVPVFKCNHSIVEILFPVKSSETAGDTKCQQKSIYSALLSSDSGVKDDASGLHAPSTWSSCLNRWHRLLSIYMMESGNKRAIVRYSKQWGVDFEESTIRTWKVNYEEELWERKLTALLPDRKQDRPLLLGEELDTAVKAYMENIRKLGGVVNTAIILGAKNHAITLQKQRTKPWHLLRNMPTVSASFFSQQHSNPQDVSLPCTF